MLSRGIVFGLFDKRMIDATVEGSGRLTRALGGVLRLSQSGNLGTYLMYLALGSLVLIIALAQP